MRSLTELVMEQPLEKCLETYSATVLYSSSFGSGGNAPLLRVIDLPGSGGQVHIHGFSMNNLTGVRLYPYDRNCEAFKPFNSYQVSMLDMYGDNIGLNKIKF